jgi:hypothetical protein
LDEKTFPILLRNDKVVPIVVLWLDLSGIKSVFI